MNLSDHCATRLPASRSLRNAEGRTNVIAKRCMIAALCSYANARA